MELDINKAKPVPRTDSRYYATEDGHIFDTKLDKYVAENVGPRGWLKCHIWQDGERKTYGVHRVIAMSYLGRSDLSVNHKNGIKTDNSINNLEYMTLQDHKIYIDLKYYMPVIKRKYYAWKKIKYIALQKNFVKYMDILHAIVIYLVFVNINTDLNHIKDIILNMHKNL